MRGRRLFLLVAGVGLVAACHPKPLSQGFGRMSDQRPMRVVEHLTCPEQVQDLRRTAEAADGASCGYVGPDGEAIALTLARLDGASAQARIDALQTGLKAEMPGAAAQAAGGAGVHVASGDRGDSARIDLPGFHLKATDGGASIRMPGVSVDADGDNAQVVTGAAGGATVSAHSGSVEVKAGGVGSSTVSTSYLLASDHAGADGSRAVGFLAKGPSGGPLVVATFHSKGDQKGDRQDVLGGLGRLVDINVHGA